MVVVIGDDMVQVSLRSIHPNTVDDLAAIYGGGGHAQASAFRVKTVGDLAALLGLNIDDKIANKRHDLKI
jgi:nanoRNase/pAp phosphatase (c-di-AMP/oligoRNAs hydrolase)